MWCVCSYTAYLPAVRALMNECLNSATNGQNTKEEVQSARDARNESDRRATDRGLPNTTTVSRQYPAANRDMATKLQPTMHAIALKCIISQFIIPRWAGETDNELRRTLQNITSHTNMEMKILNEA
jgi:hypothetical protein